MPGFRVNHRVVVDLLDAAYGAHSSDDAWVDRVLQIVMAITQGHSAGFYRYSLDYQNGAFRLQPRSLRDMKLVGPDFAVDAETMTRIAVEVEVGLEAYGRTHGTTLSGSSGFGASLKDLPWWRRMWNEPCVDVVGLFTFDTQSHGFYAGGPLYETKKLTARERTLLTRLATHLAASGRLSGTPHARRLDEAEVVLSPSGRVLHAKDGRDPKHARMRDGIDRRNFARQSRNDAEKALEVWQGLVAGRWSVIDHFDTDGKRFVLAMENAPKVPPRRELTEGAQRVVALAAMGHRDKEIAYILGLTPAAVSASLRRARLSLGVATRAELATTWRQGMALAQEWAKRGTSDVRK
jgi:DNA-binding CsgD family transcriptional regulator